VKLGDKSNDPVKLWRESTVQMRREMAASFWREAAPGLKDWAISVISRQFHCRKQTVSHWPQERLSHHLADIGSIDETLVQDIFRIYFFDCHKPMMASFLNDLGIEHKDCSISSDDIVVPTESELKETVSYLLSEFPKDKVELYLRILLFQSSNWSALVGVDLDVISPAVRSSEKAKAMIHKDKEEKYATLPDSKIATNSDLSELRSSIESTRETFEATAKLMEQLAAQLHLGILPEVSIEHMLININSKHKEITQALVARAAEVGIEISGDSLKTFAEFDQCAARIEQTNKNANAKREKLRQIREVLSSVLRLERKDGREFPALRNCQDTARHLQALLIDEWVDLDANTDRKCHALNTLVSMVKSAKEISEDEGALAYEEIGSEFGAAIVLAIERGLIVVPESGPSKTEAESRSSESEREVASLQNQHSESLKLESTPGVSINADAVDLIRTSDPMATTTAAVAVSGVVKERVPDSRVGAQTEETEGNSFHTLAEQTAQTVAQKILMSQSELDDVEIQRLAWLSLAEGKSSYAYHLVSCLERLRPTKTRQISSVLVRSFALGLEIRQPHGHVATQLKSDFGFLAAALEADSNRQTFAFRLISVSAALCPSITAPGSGGLHTLKLVLSKLSGLKNLYTICGFIADYASVQVALDPASLEYADNADLWTEQLTSLQQESEIWIEKARKIYLKFPPALRVWRNWLERGGIIHSILQHIWNNNPGSVKDLEQLLGRVATDGKTRAEVNSTDRQLKGTSVSGEINAAPLSVIQRHTREIVDMARRWVVLQENKPSSKIDYHLNKLLALRSAVDERREEILQELNTSLASTEDVTVRAGLNCCRAAIGRLDSLLHPSRESRRSEPELKYILSCDLLLIPGLTLNAEWEPLVEDYELIRILEQSVSRVKELDWQMAFEENADKWRDHDATDRIIEYLTWNAENKAFVQRLTDDQKTHLVRCQDALLRQVGECRGKIELGVSRGLVRDRERSEFLQIVERVSERTAITRNFREAQAQLNAIISIIDNAKLGLAKQVQQAMSRNGIKSDHPAHSRIFEILESGDIDTANEYVDLIGRGGSLPEKDDQQDAFGIFFPQACFEIDEFLNDPKSSASLLSRLENQKGLPGVEMGHLSDSKAKEAVEMVEAWLSLKKAKRTNQQQLKLLFEKLGFDVVSVSEGTGQPRAWVTLVVKPLKHRDECPVPYFGSLANGHYRVLCIWDHPSEEEIISLIRPGRHGDASIVLYFDRFGEMKRRALATLTRTDQLSFLFIDEILLLFLCSEGRARLPIVFNCALPFTFTNPYTTTSSLVPPEMFYGRRHERTQIIDSMGSCFVYGGRQLGKTALLISIKNEFHNPEEGRVAIWFDLKAAGVTHDELWKNLAQEFSSVHVVGLDLEKKRVDHSVLEHLQTWLEEDEKRRILLLLDEADRFLESDSKDGFKRTSLLKGLMERTNRRFKVVFAGLHNVQRTTKQENQPLAHFGEPICIGPLLDGGEWKAAKALIEQPLKSMGFKFETPDSVTRILAQTNYYPSLIQLYCNQLFQHLNRHSPASFDWQLTPPYTITPRQVEDAYTSRQLRNAIRERFELTLNLDPRYRVIALIIALYGETGEDAALDSMSVPRIRALATDFWERGFVECRSEESFRVLLEEMVGLGVLQDVDDRFALRTHNVKSLLGTQDEIESKLLRSSQEEPVPAFEAHVFRTSDQKDIWKRNPLTVIQESGLRAERNAVTVLFGMQAAGLDDLVPFLSRAFGNGLCFVCGSELTDRDYFKARLMEIKDKLKTGTSLILVRGCPWSLGWIEEAIDWIGKKTLSKFANVTFVADPSAAWRLVQKFSKLEELQSEKRLAMLSLQTWHDSVVWHWLGDCRIGTNATEEKQLISEKTGNWPHLLMEFGRKASGEPDWKRYLSDLHSRLDDRTTNTEFAEVFGLTIPEPVKVLQEMALLGGRVSIADLAGLVDTIPLSVIENSIRWADRLGLVRRSARDEWEIDPIVAKVLPFEKRK
jgi:hypothetical protein